MKFLRVIAVPLILLALAGASARADTPSVTPLWLFGGSPDGSSPAAGLILGNDGLLYGTASGGGTNNNGTVFRISPAGGALANLHTFTNNADGSSPSAALVQGSDGNFYGTTSFGGTNNAGVVFKMTTAGAVSTLWQFNDPTDGSDPFAALVQGGDGNFYGTAAGGGSSEEGTVFRISPGGSFTNLHSFSGGADGGLPAVGLIVGIDGSFYGTTAFGGTGGEGTVFNITSAGTFTTLYSFSGAPNDGSEPAATLIQVNSATFLGTTLFGGSNDAGVVFELNLSGGSSNGVTILHSFTGGADGASPQAGLILGSDGLYYGTASGGGALGNNGTIFRVDLSGNFTNLYEFTGQADGSVPLAGLVQVDSNFFGTCSAGGTNDNGTVFELGFVAGMTNVTTNVFSQITLIQIVGSNVVVTIPSFTNQTYQLQASDLMIPTNWINVVGASALGSGNPVTLTDVGGAVLTQRFYRVDIGP